MNFNMLGFIFPVLKQRIISMGEAKFIGWLEQTRARDYVSNQLLRDLGADLLKIDGDESLLSLVKRAGVDPAQVYNQIASAASLDAIRDLLRG